MLWMRLLEHGTVVEIDNVLPVVSKEERDQGIKSKPQQNGGMRTYFEGIGQNLDIKVRAQKYLRPTSPTQSQFLPGLLETLSRLWSSNKQREFCCWDCSLSYWSSLGLLSDSGRGAPNFFVEAIRRSGSRSYGRKEKKKSSWYIIHGSILGHRSHGETGISSISLFSA